MSLLDQGIVSGTRFATTVIIGRMCGPTQLGLYAITFAVILFISGLQQTLISRPYTIYGHRRSGGGKRRYAGSVLVHHALLSAAACLLTGLVGTGLYLLDLGPPNLWAVVLALAAVAPCLLLWEFARRFAFAHLKMHHAIMIDAGVATIQLGGLLLLAWTGSLSLTSGLCVIAFGCAVPGAIWLLRSKRQFSVKLPFVRRDWRKNWAFGKWIFACQLTGNLHGYAVPWIITGLIGATATGIFSACETIVLFANPVLLGLGNWLGPHTAHAYTTGGSTKVKQIARNAAVVVALGMAAFSVGLFFFGEQLLVLFFGNQYAGSGNVVALIGLSAIAWGASLALGNGLAALERSRAAFNSSAIGLVVTIALTVPFVATWNLVGAALALLAGSVSVTLYSALALFCRPEATTSQRLKDER